MKIKYKGRGKIILALFVALLTLAVITPSAFASWTGQGTGATGNGTVGEYDVSYTGSPMLWRVTLYVSTNTDGKIKETDTVESDALKWVGETIYYDWGNMYQNKKYLDYSFVQVASSVHERVRGANYFYAYAHGKEYDEEGYLWSSAPVTVNLTTGDGYFRTMTQTYDPYDGQGERLVRFNGDRFGLFQYTYGGNFSTTDSGLRGSQAGEWTTQIIVDMTNTGERASNFLKHLKSAVHQNLKSKATTMADVERYFYPAVGNQMNSECLVDYALVVEPMVMYNYNLDIAWRLPGGYVNREEYKNFDNHNVAIDAYWLSIINNNYGDIISGALGSAYGTTAARCHDTYKPDGQSHHGVICSHISGWADAAPAIYAIRGGIFPRLRRGNRFFISSVPACF